MKGGEVVVDVLREFNVRHIFGIPGVHNLPIYDALYDSKGIEHILARHEQGAAFMADGYARANGTTGVCLLGAGPGSTNALTAVSSSYLDSQPIVILAGGIRTTSWGKGAIHEIDQLGIFEKVTKVSVRPQTSSSIVSVVRMAFREAERDRKRPVFVELPFDLLTAEAEQTDESSILKEEKEADLDKSSVGRVADLLIRAHKPLIIAGGGVISSNACKELFALANLARTPVATSIMAKGSFPEDHDLSLGLLFNEVAQSAAEESDMALAIGCRFSERSTASWKIKLPQLLVQVDIDPAELGRNYPVSMGIRVDARKFLVLLIEEMNSRRYVIPNRKGWISSLSSRKQSMTSRHKADMNSDESPLKPQRVIKEVSDSITEATIVVMDTGHSFWWPSLIMKAINPRSFLCASGNAAMGFALPAAIGAKIARQDVSVVALAGDGSLLMVGEELAVAGEKKLDLVVVVFNDSGYGSIRDYQRSSFSERYIAVDYQSPDFSALAKAYGARGVVAERPGEVKEAIREATIRGGVTLIDSRISRHAAVLPDFLTRTYRSKGG